MEDPKKFMTKKIELLHLHNKSHVDNLGAL